MRERGSSLKEMTVISWRVSDTPLFCFAAALCCICRPCNRTPSKMPDATAPHAGLCFKRGRRPRDGQSDSVASRLSTRVSLVAVVSMFPLKQDCHAVRPRISSSPRWVLIGLDESERRRLMIPDLCVNPPPPAPDWPRTEEEGSDFSSALRGMCESGRSSSQDCLLIFSCQFSPPINSLRSPRRCLWPAAIQGRLQGLKVMRAVVWLSFDTQKSCVVLLADTNQNCAAN